jgi:hypothetical protein
MAAVTVVIRCDPVVRGPVVAPMWPQQPRAWKARPGLASRPDATPMAQVRASWERLMRGIVMATVVGLTASGAMVAPSRELGAGQIRSRRPRRRFLAWPKEALARQGRP